MLTKFRLRMPRHIKSLDGLRAIAVLLVLWCHVPLTLAGYPSSLAEARWWIEPGSLGVDLFFALSGFLITRILLAEQDAAQPVRWFLLRRMLRIFPIYYLLLAIMAFWRPAAELAWCALYLGNFADVLAPTPGPKPLGHTWSLCVEEHFYLIWPLIIGCCSHRVGLRVLKWFVIPVAIASAILVCVLADQHTAEIATQRLSPIRFLTLACGALLAYAEARLNASPKRLLGFGLAGIALALLLHPNIWFVYLPFAWLQTAWWPLEIAPAWIRIQSAILCTGILMWCLAPAARISPIKAALSAAPLRAVGRISYGLYLYHLPIYHSLLHAQPTWSRVLLVTTLTFAVATASYWLIERPILRYAGRFRHRPAGPSLAEKR